MTFALDNANTDIDADADERYDANICTICSLYANMLNFRVNTHCKSCNL